MLYSAGLKCTCKAFALFIRVGKLPRYLYMFCNLAWSLALVLYDSQQQQIIGI